MLVSLLRLAPLLLAVLVTANGEALAFERNTPGSFDYYALVLGWAPSYCLSEGRLRRNAECEPDKPRAFVLHGLWPQHDKGWPEDCPIGKRPWVPSPVIDEMRISCQARASSSTNTARTGPAHASIQRNILASRASSMSA